MIEPITPDIEAAVLALNTRHAEELSWLEPPELSRLVAESFYAHRIGNLEAFLIAFDQDADYGSPNFLWFKARYPHFVYVDRIVVAPEARGRGHARSLYNDLFERATRAGHDVVVCEVNSDPPNPGSEAFHAALGFSHVGEARIHGGKKAVRYFVKMIGDENSGRQSG
jgi:predicted GNAT superfamily acetyltransferase